MKDMSETKLPPSAYGPEEIERHFQNFDVSQGRYRFICESLLPSSRVLEVGCFLGRYCSHFASLGHRPTGLDISPPVIDKAKELFPDLEFHCSEKGWPEGLEKGAYDAVVASEVIEHVLHPQDFLADIRSSLKKGGKLLLTTQNSNAIHYRLRMMVGRFRWDPTHLRLYSRPELEAELREAGFDDLEFVGIPINPKGPQKLPRLFAHYAARLHPPFCWTWGVVAKVN